MSWLGSEITKLGCRVFPSQTNFFLVDVGLEGKQIYQQMLKKGVIVRPMNSYGFPNYIRITVGLEEENQRLVASLADSLRELQDG